MSQPVVVKQLPEPKSQARKSQFNIVREEQSRKVLQKSIMENLKVGANSSIILNLPFENASGVLYAVIAKDDDGALLHHLIDKGGHCRLIVENLLEHEREVTVHVVNVL